MGYGFGGFLLVVGLVLALAVTDRVSGVDRPWSAGSWPSWAGC